MKETFQQKPLSNLELAEFFNQLSLMLHSGISSLEALHLLLEDSSSDSERSLLQHMIDAIEQTGYFHQAAFSAGVFPNYALHMLRLGEETGTLDTVTEGLSEHYVREHNLSGIIKSSLMYPALMLGMMFLVIVVLLTKVMPVFQQVFQQLGQEMTGFSAGLLTLGNLLSNYSIVFVVLVVVLITLIIFGRKHLPFQKKIQDQIAACRFAKGMGIALKSGMTAEKGLDLSTELVEQEAFRMKINDCKQALSEGIELSQALRQSQIFTGPYARMTYIAGKAGVLDEAMEQISSEYEHAVNSRITSLIALLEPTLVIILSIIVGIILFSVMFPLLGIMTQL